MKRFGWMLVLLMVACAACAWAEPLCVEVPVQGASVEIRTVEIEGENWLFLPAFADMDALYPTACQTQEEGVWLDEATGMYLMQSENLRALFLLSDDPVHQGREYIEQSYNHEAYTTGTMALVDVNGTVSHADRLRQIRGRGNGTWSNAKKPYQFKLENRADLLGVGEAARTWVLLAEVMDETLLRNRIALDLALEMGLSETSHSEFVDLYYDGEYRGLYLLAEKVEIGQGRVEGRDYDKLIEAWNEQAGTGDLTKLEVQKGENAFGNEIRYLQGLHDNGMTDAGAYLLEMEDEAGTLSDRCWFRMDDGSVIALKNPENASEAMVRYASEHLTRARRILQNGGSVSPDGDTIEDVFDVDAFARTALLYELSYSDSGFHYSSTYFVLPEGETRFRPGPVWDFDLTWGYYRSGVNAGGVGVKDESGWLTEFYGVPVFSARMRRIYQEEMFPLIRQVLLGETEGAWLKPLNTYNRLIAQSRRMNSRLWTHSTFWRFEPDKDEAAAVDSLRRFIDERSLWLADALANDDVGDTATLWLYAPYTYVRSSLEAHGCPWDPVQIVSVHSEMISEATEEDYALWETEILLQRRDGADITDPQFVVCGTPVEAQVLADGKARVLVAFEDPSYRPVDYYGEDIGLVYNPDIYVQNHPEIAAEYEDDPEGLMDYFCDEGMYEDHMGNAFFRPSEILSFNSKMMETLGEDWWTYYWDFLYYGHADGWLLKAKRGFIPQVTDAL